MNALMANCSANATVVQGRGGSMHVYAGDVGISVVPMVAATIPIAVGAALSASIKD